MSRSFLAEKAKENARPATGPASPPSPGPRATEQSETCLSALFSALSDPAMLLDRDGAIWMANQAFASLVSRKIESLIGHDSFAFLPPSLAAARRRKLEETLRLGTSQVVEETQGDRSYVTTLCPLFDGTGAVTRVAIVHRDMSPPQRTDARLKESEIVYRNIVESASDGIVILEEGRVTYANRRLEILGGYEPGEVIGMPVTRFVHPAELPRLAERLQQRKDNDGYRAKYETVLIDKSGRSVFVEVNSSALSIHPGKDATLVMVRDVSARRQAEQALREAEDKYRRLVDQSLTGIYITAEGRLKFCNRKFAEIFGYERPEDMIDVEVKELIAPESLGLVVQQTRLRETGQADNVHYEFRATRRDGTPFDVEVFGSQFDDKGQPAILGTLIDITERKGATRSLAESNTRLQALLQAMPDVVYFKDFEGRNLTVNKAFEEMVGLSHDLILGKKDHDIFPAEMADKCLISDREVLSSLKPVRFHEDMTSPAGLQEVFETYKAPIFDGPGKPAGLVGVSRNITEQRRREKIQDSILGIARAAISSESLETLFLSIHTSIAELMPAKNFYIALYDGASDLVTFPYFVDEYDQPPGPKKMGKGLTEYVFRTGVPLLATPEVFAELERAGEVESLGAPSIDWLGVPLQVEEQTFGVLVVQSYTEGVRYGREERDILSFVSGQVGMAISRRRAAADIQDREQFLSGVLDSIQDGISILDKDFTIVRVNRTMERRHAASMPLVGKKCYEAYRRQAGPCNPCPTQETLRTSLVAHEVIKRTTDDSRGQEWLDLYSFPFIDQITGQMKGVIEYVRDITLRKEAENRLQSSLREKEVLLREIHHRVKNNLQVIQSLISLQTRQIKDEQAVEMCKESQRRIRSMALVHERLYQSTDLSRIEFADYLRSLVIHLFHSMLSDPTRVLLDMADLEPVHLNINTAIPCGLIVNELVSNALKHAFPGEKSGTITLSIRKAEDGGYRLGVKDNGIGLPAEFEIDKSETMGMQIVTTLVSQLGGRLAVGRNGGADFQVHFQEVADSPGVESHG